MLYFGDISLQVGALIYESISSMAGHFSQTPVATRQNMHHPTPTPVTGWQNHGCTLTPVITLCQSMGQLVLRVPISFHSGVILNKKRPWIKIEETDSGEKQTTNAKNSRRCWAHLISSTKEPWKHWCGVGIRFLRPLDTGLQTSKFVLNHKWVAGSYFMDLHGVRNSSPAHHPLQLFLARHICQSRLVDCGLFHCFKWQEWEFGDDDHAGFLTASIFYRSHVAWPPWERLGDHDWVTLFRVLLSVGWIDARCSHGRSGYT